MKISLALGLATLGFVFAECIPCRGAAAAPVPRAAPVQSYVRLAESSHSDSKVRRRRRHRDDSSSSSSSSNSCSRSSDSYSDSSSSSECDRPVRRPCRPTPTPDPVPRCERMLLKLMADFDAPLLEILRSISTEYNQTLDGLFAQLDALFQTIVLPTPATDFVDIINQLNVLLGVPPLIPLAVADVLQDIQDAILAEIQAGVRAAFIDLVANLQLRLDSLCVGQSIEFLLTGIFAETVSAAMNIAGGIVFQLSSVALVREISVIQEALDVLAIINPAVMTLATNLLSANMVGNLNTPISIYINNLGTQVIALAATLNVDLLAIITNGVKEFQNTGINRLNNIVETLFGTGFSTPIPPVLMMMAASLLNAIQQPQPVMPTLNIPKKLLPSAMVPDSAVGVSDVKKAMDDLIQAQQALAKVQTQENEQVKRGLDAWTKALEEVKTAQTALTKAQEDAKTAQDALVDAQDDAKDAVDLVGPAQAAVDSANSALANAQRDAETAQAALDSANGALTNAQRDAETAQDALDNANSALTNAQRDAKTAQDAAEAAHDALVDAQNLTNANAKKDQEAAVKSAEDKLKQAQQIASMDRATPVLSLEPTASNASGASPVV